jgi:hypothetical protein
MLLAVRWVAALAVRWVAALVVRWVAAAALVLSLQLAVPLYLAARTKLLALVLAKQVVLALRLVQQLQLLPLTKYLALILSFLVALHPQPFLAVPPNNSVAIEQRILRYYIHFRLLSSSASAKLAGAFFSINFSTIKPTIRYPLLNSYA